jgi:hypothetical protein
MKRLILLLAIAMCGANAFSGVLTPEAALNRAQSTTAARHIKGINNTAKAELLTTFTANNQPAVYLFGRGDKGYLVVSADDMTDAVLGYCDEGNVDTNNMPPAMTYLLESYANQIAYVRENATDATKVTRHGPERAAIHPLCTTKWGQSSPYNDKCPNQYATGCTATALAQVLKYFGGIQGSGTASYTWNGETLSYDFDATSFDWNSMLNTYGNDATDTQKEAVASLLYACGVTLQMNYASGGSGAYAINVVKYSADSFNLDKGIRYYNRDYYGYDEWNNLIYDALKNCGPVMLGGAIVNTSYYYAHEFVCDGYGSDDLFHINWGWNGQYDGYFRLNALDPYSYGIEPVKSAYNYYQDAVCYIQPEKEDSTPFIQLVCNSFSIRNTAATLGNTVSLNGGAINYSSCVLSGTIGMKICDINGNLVQYVAATSSFSDLAIGGSLSSPYSVRTPKDLAEGTYTITPVFKDTDDEWHDIRCKPSGVDSYTMTVKGTKAYFTADESGAVQVADFKLATPFVVTASDATYNALFRLNAQMSSAKEYYGKVALAFFDSDNTLQSTYSYVPLYIPAGETLDFDIYESSKSIVAGETYRLALVDGAGNIISDYIEATAESSDAYTWTAEATDMAVSNADAVDCHDVNVTFNINCTDGFFHEIVWLIVYDSNNKQATAWEIYPISMVAGESKEYNFHADFGNATPGETYTVYPYTAETAKWINKTGCKFTVADTETNAVHSITTSSDNVVATEYYNLQGVRIGDSITTPGLYIKVEKLADGTRHSSRIIIR